MRSLSLVLGAVLLASGCLSGPDAADAPGDGPDRLDVDPPSRTEDAIVLAVGDHWVQRAYDEHSADETIRVVEYYVAAREMVRVGSDDVAAYRIENRDGNRTHWLRADDWALVRTAVHGEATDVDPACAAYAWPSALGTDWVHHCRRLGTDVHGAAQGEVGRTLHSRVMAEERVVVPAGEFDVVRIRTTVAQGTGDTIEESFAPEACFPARTVIRGDGSPIVIDLIAYACGGR